MSPVIHDWWRPPTEPEAIATPGDAPAEAPGRTGAAPYAALLAFLAISLLAPQSFVPALAALRLALVTAVVAGATLVMDRVSRGRPLVTWTPEMRFAAGLAVWAVATVPASYWPGGSARFLTGMYLKTLVVFWLLASVVDTRRRLGRVVWLLSLVSVPLALTGIRNFLSGAFLPEGLALQRIVGYDAPLTENPNDLALMLNLLLPLTIARLTRERGRGRRLLLAAILATNVVAVVVTFSRAGFLALMTTAVVYGWRLARRAGRGWLFGCGLLSLLALPLLPSGYTSRLSTIIDVDADPTGSAQARRADLLAAVAFVQTHPIIGAGIDQNVLALNEERGAAWKAVHNVYLQLAVDLGLPGLVLFLLLLGASLRGVRRVRRECAGDAAAQDVASLAEGVEVSLLAFSIAAFFHPVAYHSYFYDVAGLAVAVQAVARNARCENASAS